MCLNTQIIMKVDLINLQSICTHVQLRKRKGERLYEAGSAKDNLKDRQPAQR